MTGEHVSSNHCESDLTHAFFEGCSPLSPTETFSGIRVGGIFTNTLPSSLDGGMESEMEQEVDACTLTSSRTRLGSAGSSPSTDQQNFKAPFQHLLPRVGTAAHPCPPRIAHAGTERRNRCCLHLHFLTLNLRRVMRYIWFSCAVFLRCILHFLLLLLPVHALAVWILP